MESPTPMVRLIGSKLLAPALCLAMNLTLPGTAVAEGTVRGPKHTTVDLLRVHEHAPKIYVEAMLPDGQPAIFMVDTGAEMSVLSESAASRIAMDEGRKQRIVGVTGVASVRMTTLPWLRLGETTVTQLEVAVGAPGASEMAVGVPLDGILGNNVWRHFIMDLDYRADTLTLHRPQAFRMPRRADAMHFDGAHIFARVTFVPREAPEAVGMSWVALDTGAHDLLFRGPHGAAYQGPYHEGVEPIFGVATAADLPVSSYLQETRRIPLQRVMLGGTEVEVDFDAIWMSPETDDPQRSWTALAGHEIWDGKRVLFDYQGGEYAILPARSRPDFHDAREHLLNREVTQHGLAPERALTRATLHLGRDDRESALEDLQALIATDAPSLGDLREAALGIAARIHRARGQLAEADALLARLGPSALADEGELVGVVNSLILEGEIDAAARLVDDAFSAVGGKVEVLVARADVQLARGHHRAAQASLQRSREIIGDANAFALREARIRVDSGDHDGAIATLREAVQDNPLDGRMLWFYARIADERDLQALARDVAHVRAHVHRRLQPHDFLAGALLRLGDVESARWHHDLGVKGDCADLDGPGRDNCTAWYGTLSGGDGSLALALVDSSLAEAGERSDYLDTKAMVHSGRGEHALAHEVAHLAARLAPDDPYMLLQAYLAERATHP